MDDLYTWQDLKNLKNQPPEMCMAAVRKDWRALQYVEKQTTEICMAAIEQNSYALQYVKNQTSEMCMAAVRKDGWTLDLVRNQTPEICMTAVKQKGWALQLVKEQTPEICMAAVKENGAALQHVKNQTPELCMEAVKQNGWALKFVKKEYQTPEICVEAVKQNKVAMEYITNEAPEIYIAVAKQNGLILKYIKDPTPEICLEAVKQNKQASQFIKEELKQDILNKYQQYLTLQNKESSIDKKSLFIDKNKSTYKEKIMSDLNEKVEGNSTQVLGKSDRTPVERITTDKFKQLLAADKLPFLPNENGFCNVKAVKTAAGYELKGANQLIAKMYLHERGVDNDNILTFRQAQNAKTSIRAGEKGFYLSFYDKEKNSNTVTRYFAESQTSNPDVLPYQPVKAESKKEKHVQISSDAQDYITNYLKCVNENRVFTASPEVAAEFKENFAKELEKSPMQIFKMGDRAAKEIFIETDKGKEWLKTEKGQQWLKTENGKDFLKTNPNKGIDKGKEVQKSVKPIERAIAVER